MLHAGRSTTALQDALQGRFGTLLTPYSTRKVKCDEGRPACQKCVSTGRTCDGYPLTFRAWTATPSEPRKGVQTGVQRWVQTVGPSKEPSSEWASGPITATDIDDLQRCFSTKTLFPTITLECADEARQVLQASQTDPAVRHAVSSLRALRADLEASAQSAEGIAKHPTHLSTAASSYAAATGTTPGGDYGLQQYCLALGGLAAHLSSSSSSTSTSTSNQAPAPSVRSALLCCQVFISIEQVRGHFAAMAQHIVQGLRILYEHRGRDQGDQDLPALDVFVIKFFAAPCKFADVSRGAPSSADFTPASTTGSEGGPSCRFRPLAPDLRSELTRHAVSTVSFLANVKTGAGTPTQSLQSTKASLLQSLAMWHASLEREQQMATQPQLELLSILFLRFFHQILRVILLSALYDKTDKETQSEIVDAEYKQLQSIASFVGERVYADGRQNGEW